MTGCRKRLESDASVQSLPADLERVISVCENELSSQASYARPCGLRSSIDSTLSSESDDAFIGATTQNAEAVQMSGADGDASGSSRESLYDASDSQNTHQGKLPPTVVSAGGRIDLQRFAMYQRARASSSDATETRNRTMLLQVGENELTLISLDRKTVIFERHFKDISFCSQVITECVFAIVVSYLT